MSILWRDKTPSWWGCREIDILTRSDNVTMYLESKYRRWPSPLFQEAYPWIWYFRQREQWVQKVWRSSRNSKLAGEARVESAKKSSRWEGWRDGASRSRHMPGRGRGGTPIRRRRPITESTQECLAPEPCTPMDLGFLGPSWDWSFFLETTGAYWRVLSRGVRSSDCIFEKNHSGYSEC